jgi:hypothetical protein
MTTFLNASEKWFAETACLMRGGHPRWLVLSFGEDGRPAGCHPCPPLAGPFSFQTSSTQLFPCVPWLFSVLEFATGNPPTQPSFWLEAAPRL